MKKHWIAAKCVMITLGMAGIAHAGTHNWTGLYAGMDAGVSFNDAHLTSQQLGFSSLSETCNRHSDFSTFFTGIQLGYMYEFKNAIVAGVEANPTLNVHQRHTFTCQSEFNPDVHDSFIFRNQLQTAIKGRVGRTLNWSKSTFLPYLVVGPSFANLGLTYQNEGGNHYSKTTNEVGFLVGGGLEWAFTQHWSLRAEYNFMDYGNAINLKIPTVYGLFDRNGKSEVNLKSNNVVVAVNYWI